MTKSNLQSVQWLRGLAVLSVVCYHLGIFPKGYVGVDLFFAISGFVILNSISSKQLFIESENARKDFFIFLKKRFWRIYPAMIFVITASLFYSLFQVTWLNEAQKNVGKYAVSSFLSVANFYSYKNATNYFEAGNTSKPLLHLWSVSVEIQLYIFFAVVVMFFAKLKTKEKIKDLIIFILFLVSFYCSIFYLNNIYSKLGLSSPDNLGFYSPLNRIWEFFFGCVVFVLYSRNRNQLRNKYHNLILILLIILLLVALDSKTLKITYLMFLIVIYFGRNLKTSPILTPLKIIGDRSYSIYLWHMPVIYFFFNSRSSIFNLVLTITLILLFSNLTFIHVEQKFRNGIKLQNLKALVLALSLPVILIFLINFGISEKIVSKIHNNLDITNKHLSAGGWEKPFGNCSNKNVFNNYCIRTDNYSDNFIIGDSHAGSFVQVRDAKLPNNPYKFKESLIHPGCSLILPNLSENSDCLSASKKVEEILKLKSNLTIFYSEDYQLYGSLYEKQLGNSSCTAYMECAFEGYISSNYGSKLMGELIKLNEANNQKIFLIGAAPRLVGWPNQFNLWNLAIKGKHDVYSEYSNSVANKINDDLSKKIMNLQTQGKKIQFINPTHYVCKEANNKKCKVFSAQTSSLYWDADHLSVSGAQKVLDGGLSK